MFPKELKWSKWLLCYWNCPLYFIGSMYWGYMLVSTNGVKGSIPWFVFDTVMFAINLWGAWKIKLLEIDYHWKEVHEFYKGSSKTS